MNSSDPLPSIIERDPSGLLVQRPFGAPGWPPSATPSDDGESSGGGDQ